MAHISHKTAKRKQRHGRVRAKVSGTAGRPRLSVFKSNRVISAQLIDDTKGETLVAASSAGAIEDVGAEIAKGAKAKGITHVVFDRGGFLYRGKIARLAESARKGGLIF